MLIKNKRNLKKLDLKSNKLRCILSKKVRYGGELNANNF